MTAEEELGVAWETGVSSLGNVIASSTQRWGQHAGALIGLLTLGPVALHNALVPYARGYYNRLSSALNTSTKDSLDAHTTAGLVLVSKSFRIM